MAAGSPIASAFVRIRPTFQGFSPALAKGVQSGGGREAGAKLGKAISDGASREVSRSRSAFAGLGARLGQGITSGAARAVTGSGRLFARVGANVGGGIRLGVIQSFRGIGSVIAGAFAAVGAVTLFKDFIGEARESQKVGAQTAAVLRSTGGAAKVTAAQVGDLATAISNKVGVDDEAIQSGENLLLTFTNIRNAAGRNNDVFNQASRVLVDMTAAMNGGVVTSQNLKSSAIQVGKALNDPVKGITALTRVGVTFTAGQKKQIESLVASGRTLQAQKIILRELNREFGGSAAASATAGQKLSIIFGNIKERVGTALLPTLDRFENFLSARLPGAVEVGTRVIGRVGAAIGGLFQLVVRGNFTRALRDAFHVEEDSPVLAIVANLRGTVIAFVRDALPKLRAGLAAAFGFVSRTVVPALASMARFVSRNRDYFITFGKVVLVLVAALKVWAVVQGAINLLLSANPVGAVVVALAALSAGVIQAYKHSDRFRAVVDRVGQFFTQTFLPAVRQVGQFLVTTFAPVVRRIGEYFATSFVPTLQRVGRFFTQTLYPAILQVGRFLVQTFAPAFRAIGSVLTGSVLPALQGLLARVRDNLPQFIGLAKFLGRVLVIFVGLSLKISGFLLPILIRLAGFLAKTLFAAIGVVIGTIGALIGAAGKAGHAFVTFGRVVGTAAAAVFNWIKTHWPLLLAVLTGPIGLAVLAIVKSWDRIRSTFTDLWTGLKTIVRTGVASVVDFFLGMVGTIIHGAAAAFGWIPGIGKNLKAAAAAFDRFRKQVNDSLLGINDRNIKVSAYIVTGQRAATASGAGAGRRNQLQRGGRIPGYGGGDTVPAMLERGEAVVPKHLVPEIAGWARTRRIPGFAAGGIAGGVTVSPRFSGLDRLDKTVADVNRTLARMALALQAQEAGRFTGNASVAAVAATTARLLGRPAEAAAWARRIMFESGGRWDAVNRSDSNWRAGHPSVGGAQVIAGTFAAYAGRYRNTGPFLYGVSINPLANSYAGGNYAVHRYGSLAAVDPLVRHRGYDRGGWLMPGATLAVNNTGRPEPVGIDYDRMGRAVAKFMSGAHLTFSANDTSDMVMARLETHLGRGSRR